MFVVAEDLVEGEHTQDVMRKGVDCSPIVTSLPVHSSLYQTVSTLMRARRRFSLVEWVFKQ